MDFNVHINDCLLGLSPECDFAPNHNKYVVGILNDFEDGQWRYSKFHNFIWDNIAETALSYSERHSLAAKSQTQLIEAARNLQLTDSDDTVGVGSELAEIALYGLMKHHYGALPAVPKIFYKQNSQDPAKGADSVHIIVDEANYDFSMWFGEAKFYDSLDNSRLGKIVTSVANSLKTDKLKKENSIVTSLSDIRSLVSDPELADSIIAALSPRESIDGLKPKIHVPIFLLHECAITASATALSNDYLASVREYQRERMTEYFRKQSNKLAELSYYESVTFHLVLFPVPDKQRIVQRFTSRVSHYREED